MYEYALIPDLCIEPTFENVNCIRQCEMFAIQKLPFHMTWFLDTIDSLTPQNLYK